MAVAPLPTGRLVGAVAQCASMNRGPRCRSSKGTSAPEASPSTRSPGRTFGFRWRSRSPSFSARSTRRRRRPGERCSPWDSWPLRSSAGPSGRNFVRCGLCTGRSSRSARTPFTCPGPEAAAQRTGSRLRRTGRHAEPVAGEAGEASARSRHTPRTRCARRWPASARNWRSRARSHHPRWRSGSGWPPPRPIASSASSRRCSL